MYYKVSTNLIKCALCGLKKTDAVDIEFHPIYKGGQKFWLCHSCKVCEDLSKKEDKFDNGITMIFKPKN